MGVSTFVEHPFFGRMYTHIDNLCFTVVGDIIGGKSYLRVVIYQTHNA